MARAPLRPVPGPTEPINDAAAVALVGAALPSLPEPDRTVLALVALAGRPRGQVALRLGLSGAELAERLAQARKQLRRSVAALGGSGWCEHAERLISDRMDGVLADGDERRLDIHLRNCPRCVEHERRLVQATDALVSGSPVVPAAAAALAAKPARATTSAAAPDAEPTPLPLPLTWAVVIVVALVLAVAALALVLAGAL
jgi:Putative zinc-finger